MEQATIRWRVFNSTVQNIKASNADTDPDKLQGIIDDALRQGSRRQAHQKGQQNLNLWSGPSRFFHLYESESLF